MAAEQVDRGRRSYDRWTDSMRRNRDFHAAISRELDFVFKQRQYLDDNGAESASDLLQMRTQAPFRLVRYKASQLLSIPLWPDCQPIDEYTDVDDAELVRWVLEHEMLDLDRGFQFAYSDMVWGGLSARRWCMAADWEPSYGAFGGDLLYRGLDPRNLHRRPGVRRLHDARNDWVSESRYVSLDFIAEMRDRGEWKFQGEISSDDGLHLYPGTHPVTMSGSGVGGSPALPEMGWTEQQGATLLFEWCRYDAGTRTRPRDGSYRRLPDAERFMWCPCGYESATQGEQGFEFPKTAPRGCPRCKSDLTRADATYTEDTLRRFPGGKRLVISAPLSQYTVLYDGPWPFPKMRSFPFAEWNTYLNPAEEWGPSDTYLNWSQNMSEVSAIRLGLEALMDARDLTILPKSGLYDEHDQPYRKNDDPNPWAYYNEANGPPPEVSRIAGGRMNESIPAFVNLVIQNRRENEGTADLSSFNDPGRSKDIPVGTVERLVQTGNAPIDEHFRSISQAMGTFMGTISDMCAGGWSDERAIRTRTPGGREAMMRLRGQDIPQVDVFITMGPAAQSLNDQKAKTWQMLQQVPPERRRSFALATGVSMSLVRMLEREDEEIRQKQQEQARKQAAMTAGNGGMGAPAAGGVDPRVMAVLAARGRVPQAGGPMSAPNGAMG